MGRQIDRDRSATITRPGRNFSTRESLTPYRKVSRMGDLATKGSSRLRSCSLSSALRGSTCIGRLRSGRRRTRSPEIRFGWTSIGIKRVRIACNAPQVPPWRGAGLTSGVGSNGLTTGNAAWECKFGGKPVRRRSLCGVRRTRGERLVWGAAKMSAPFQSGSNQGLSPFSTCPIGGR
jgi:hypothetical protein